MRRRKKKMLALKATDEDSQMAEAIRQTLHSGATSADALREALAFFCQQRKLKWQDVRPPEGDQRFARS